MINEEWLCSSFKLCDLATASKSGHSDDSMQIIINGDSYPQPAYNPSSIQHTMETYSRLLDGTLEQNMPIQIFAHMTAKAIIDSSVRIRGPSESVKVRQDEVEMLAEELTLKVCCKALVEMERQHHSDDSSSKNINDIGVMEGTNENASVLCSSGYNCDTNAFEIETDKMEEYDDDTLAIVYANSLKSMGSLGSLDYPDAPPSTPLLPEMLRSRASFTRKLKGGLAKEFLPSPPPPTPKDHMRPLLENQMTDTSADFMVRLMRSLSLECCRNGGLEEVTEREPDNAGLQNDRLTDYAGQISADILHSLFTNEIKVKDEGCVNRMLAISDRLASEIVTTSLAKVMARGEIKVLKEETTLCSMAPDNTSSMPFSATDEVKVLANELIIDALVHAFAKLNRGVFEHGTQPHLSGQAAEPQPWEEERCANTLCKDSTNSLKDKRCRNDKSELNPITVDGINVTSSVHTFANDFAEDVLQHSVCDASRFLFNCKQSEGAELGSQKDIKPQVIKIHAEESRHVQELQCALLWAAASQNGTSVLHFDLPDTSLQQQLCRLSRSARLNGWTVGALMASLEEYCDMQRATSRGRYESSDSLLEHLQHLIDNSHLN